MATIESFPGNCGMRVLRGLNGPVEPQMHETLKKISADFRIGMIAFTDAVAHRNGQRVADFITKHKLGTLTESPQVRNPNTGRKIKAWFWHINRAALEKWAAENPEPKQQSGRTFRAWV